MTLEEKVARLQVVCDALLESGKATDEALEMLSHLGRPTIDLAKVLDMTPIVLRMPGGRVVEAFVSRSSMHTDRRDFEWWSSEGEVRPMLQTTVEVTFQLVGPYPRG